MNRQNNQYLGAIIGHAVGDAMGFPTEFSKREELLKSPVIEMIDSPDVGQPACSWSDDTAMEIATIDSFIQKKYFDYKDIMDKWVKWISKSEYTPTGVAFDIGRTCLKAIKNIVMVQPFTMWFYIYKRKWEWFTHENLAGCFICIFEEIR